jgi:hypothetical protein
MRQSNRHPAQHTAGGRKLCNGTPFLGRFSSKSQWIAPATSGRLRPVFGSLIPGGGFVLTRRPRRPCHVGDPDSHLRSWLTFYPEVSCATYFG